MNKYRYILVDSFLNKLDRTQDGVFLKQESAPFYRIDSNDYSEFETPSEIESTSGITVNIPSGGISAKTHNTLYRTVNTEDNITGTEENLFIWLADIPLVVVGTALSYVDSTMTVLIDSKTGITDDDSAKWLIGNLINTLQQQYTIVDIEKTENANEFEITVSGAITAIGDTFAIGSNVPYNITHDSLEKNCVRFLKSAWDSEIAPDLRGEMLFFANGATGIVRNYNSFDYHVFVDFNMDDSEVNIVDDVNLFDYFSLNAGAGTIKYTDTTIDDTLNVRVDSGEAAYLLQTRFHKPLDSTDKSAVLKGAMFTISDDQIKYCQTANIYRSGYYHPGFQYNNKIVNKMTRVVEYPEYLIIFCKSSTYYLEVAITRNVGEPDLGEFIPVFADPILLSSKIGCLGDRYACKNAGSGEVIVTTEPAIRDFNGISYSSGDITADSIKNKQFVDLGANVVSYWDKETGYNLFGFDTQKSLVFGNSMGQGFGWHINNGDNLPVPEFLGESLSIIGTFGEGISLVFSDGLPYINNLFSNIKDTLSEPIYYDKYDYLNPETLNSISCRISPRESRGAKSSYSMKISDINLFLRPQNAEYLSDFIVGMEGFENYSLNKNAEASDIPLDRELFFDKELLGKVLRIAFTTNNSGFKMISLEYYLEVYDKATFPFKNKMTEADIQLNLASMDFWITRGCQEANYDYISKELITTTSSSKIDGADGKVDTGISIEQSIAFPSGKLYFFTKTNPATLGVTEIDNFEVNLETWYFVSYDGSFLHGSSFSAFDIRIYDTVLSTDDLSYWLNDVKSNSADIVCNGY
jgi:hypothetical protein